jgi:hypothetical protein
LLWCWQGEYYYHVKEKKDDIGGQNGLLLLCSAVRTFYISQGGNRKPIITSVLWSFIMIITLLVRHKYTRKSNNTKSGFRFCKFWCISGPAAGQILKKYYIYIYIYMILLPPLLLMHSVICLVYSNHNQRRKWQVTKKKPHFNCKCNCNSHCTALLVLPKSVKTKPKPVTDLRSHTYSRLRIQFCNFLLISFFSFIALS